MALLDGLDQNTAAMLLGTHRPDDFRDVEPEHPDCLAVIWPGGEPGRVSTAPELPLFLDQSLVKDLAAGTWYGKANELSREHGVHWEVIDEVAEESWKTTPSRSRCCSTRMRHFRSDDPVSPKGGRRQDYQAAAECRLLRRPNVHFGRYVFPHAAASDAPGRAAAIGSTDALGRVGLGAGDPSDVVRASRGGLPPGLYVLVRDPNKLPLLQQSMNPELEWTPAPGCPPDLPLYWLFQGDAQRLAAQVSCHQGIAGDSAFSLGMLAEFEGRLRQGGPWWYPRLFWESGLVGQVLYLEAEAAGDARHRHRLFLRRSRP